MSFLLAFALNVTHIQKNTLVLLHRYVICILHFEEKCGFLKYLVWKLLGIKFAAQEKIFFWFSFLKNQISFIASDGRGADTF